MKKGRFGAVALLVTFYTWTFGAVAAEVNSSSCRDAAQEYTETKLRRDSTYLQRLCDRFERKPDHFFWGTGLKLRRTANL